MYYRRKVLLSLLEMLNRKVGKTAFQKYLFLTSFEQDHPAYDFVPYHYGCFSFQAEADKRTLTKYGFLEDQDDWAISGNQRFFSSLKCEDREAINGVVDQLGTVSSRELIRYVYRKHPYYAINSESQREILNRREQKQVDSARPTASIPARLFTVGYEGQTLERYLNQLIEQNIGVLCDVRRNPVSMKFGFSKRQLHNAVNGLGIAYVHMPELGIDSRKRRDLNTPEDYQALFDEYAETTLANSNDALRRIIDLIRKFRRVALTCFEADNEFCHRTTIAESLSQRNDFHHRVAHL